MARSTWSLRVKVPARATSAFRRSAFAVFSLSINAPHSPRTLSSSSADIADMQAVGSTGETLLLSAPVACSRGAMRVANAINRIFRRARIGLRTWDGTAPVIMAAAAFAAKIRIRQHTFDASHSRYFAREIFLNLWAAGQTQLS